MYAPDQCWDRSCPVFALVCVLSNRSEQCLNGSSKTKLKHTSNRCLSIRLPSSRSPSANRKQRPASGELRISRLMSAATMFEAMPAGAPSPQGIVRKPISSSQIAPRHWRDWRRSCTKQSRNTNVPSKIAMKPMQRQRPHGVDHV